MVSHDSPNVDAAPADAELLMPHPQFPSWTRRETYDRITAMYLDCWNSAEIAKELAAELHRDITPDFVDRIRTEAARAAEGQPHDIRLRWTYRFSRLTVNNLVKEYMFIERRQSFAQAKMELAKEIEVLVKDTSPGRLCIAINDALGRNNIGMDILDRLQAHARTARKVMALIKPHAEASGIPPDRALENLAAKAALWHDSEGGKDSRRTAAFIADILKQDVRLIAHEDIDYLLELWHMRNDDDAGSTLAERGAGGADVMAAPDSVLDQIVDDAGLHLPYTTIRQLIDTLRSSPVLPPEKLARIEAYATRHLKDLETMRRLGKKSPLPAAIQKIQIHALRQLKGLAHQHHVVTDMKTFFTAREFAYAARNLIPPRDIQAVLDRLNSLKTAEEVTSTVGSLRSRVRKFEFPLDRYLKLRFRLPKG